jgi:septum formation protein
MRLILASASARRRDLLEAAGVQFTARAVDADERRLDGEAPDAYVARVARLKADTARISYPSDVILAADTVVIVDDTVLGKPANDDDARRMLESLSGRSHEVLTGVVVLWPGQERSVIERTQVWFGPLTDADIRDYISSGEPRDKAGAYAIQGLASRFVTRIDGSYSNVVGLPMATVWYLLQETPLD